MPRAERIEHWTKELNSFRRAWLLLTKQEVDAVVEQAK